MSYVKLNLTDTDLLSARALRYIETQYDCILPDVAAHNHDTRYPTKTVADATYNYDGSGRPTDWDAGTLDGLTLEEVAARVLPVGIILGLKPSANHDGSNLPDGWALCNGSNGTPDLREYFVPCASSSHAAGTTAGSRYITPTASLSITAHALTIDEMPSHRHNLPTDDYGAGSRAGVSMDTAPHSTTTQTSYTELAGSGQGHGHAGSTLALDQQENAPQHHSIWYIKKVA